MHLSPPSYRSTSFSASSLLILCLCDLDCLSQESIFSLPLPHFFLLPDRDVTKTRPVGVLCWWWGGGKWHWRTALHCPLASDWQRRL